MRTGITGGAYARNWGDKRYAKMREHGWDCCDFSLADTDTELFTLDDKGFEDSLRAEKELADTAGISFFQVHGPWRWPPRDNTAEDRAERFEKMVKTMRGCTILGAQNWVIHPIMPFGWDRDPEPEKFHEMNLEFFSRLIPEAKKYGVTICLENMPMTALSLSTPEQIFSFVNEIDDDSLQICLDTGHAAVFGIQPADAVRLFGDKMKAMHVHDNDGHGDRHWFPYTGVVDWEAFKNAISDIGYDGVISFETSPSASVPVEIAEKMLVTLNTEARYFGSIL